MYLAKEDGKNSFRFFVEQTEAQSIERRTLETALRQVPPGKSTLRSKRRSVAL